jgi:hypothetical protein
MGKSTPMTTPSEIREAGNAYLEELGRILRLGEDALNAHQQVEKMGNDEMAAISAERVRKWLEEAKTALG